MLLKIDGKRASRDTKFIVLTLLLSFLVACATPNGGVKRLTTEELMGNLVDIPSGSFQMGSHGDKETELPVRQVSVASFKMQEHEVTWAQYQPCVDAGVCVKRSDEGWGKGNLPVINVSWGDVQIYITWLNKKTKKTFRLPTEAEWEYAARANTTTPFYWGSELDCHKANFGHNEGEGVCGKEIIFTQAVKSYAPNEFSLYDMSGNVWEWTQDCWEKTYQGAPSDGSAWLSGNCLFRVARGGGWGSDDIRVARRYRYDGPQSWVGFRLVQDQ